MCDIADSVGSFLLLTFRWGLCYNPKCEVRHNMLIQFYAQKTLITVVVLLAIYSTVVGIVHFIRTKNKIKIIMSPTNKYEVVFQKSSDFDEFLYFINVKQKKTQQVVYSNPIGGKIVNMNWSPKDDLLVVETVQRRIEVLDLLKGKQVPIRLDYNRQPEITDVGFQKWVDQNFRIGVKRKSVITEELDIDRNGNVTPFSIQIP